MDMMNNLVFLLGLWVRADYFLLTLHHHREKLYRPEDPNFALPGGQVEDTSQNLSRPNEFTMHTIFFTHALRLYKKKIADAIATVDVFRYR
ncbi:hypothetical protein GGR58DRAFT_468446 [Xylaria digitata]|nr:hypothetical protein GGR58DRAFT_468446 [Xylaria digitata]